ncbi:hypothetical protein BJX76DRAFT_361906 [Aspergillus varians]
MKFSVAAAALFAAGAVAAQQYTTVEVTEYATYCPSATTLIAGSETYPVETPGIITLSGGPYTVTRPLLTTTVTHCNACSSATPTVAPSVPASSVPVVPSVPASSVPVIPVVPGVPSSSAPVIPSAPTDVAPTAGASSTTPVAPAFTGGASRAAAGVGAVAGLFGVVAALL